MPCSEAAGGGALLLLLADGRFPGGGHAHSGGLEAAVADGSVCSEASLRSYLHGRLLTAGPTEAWFAAAAHRCADDADALAALAARYEARTPSAAQRAAARTLGRGLRRVARTMWPDLATIAVEPYPVVLGIVASHAGLAAIDAARVAVHQLLTGAATAAPKLFAIDMVDALRAAAAVAALADGAVSAAASATAPPPRSAPLTELRADAHAAWDVRLFAS